MIDLLHRLPLVLQVLGVSTMKYFTGQQMTELWPKITFSFDLIKHVGDLNIYFRDLWQN